mmetsp:Transcript_79538/g.230886  ORF Transcript_79538/g.230886 Transcript_79538/m.230886 type:complete len:259 (-) Transcript_79538:293-1069(-)
MLELRSVQRCLRLLDPVFDRRQLLLVSLVGEQLRLQPLHVLMGSFQRLFQLVVAVNEVDHLLGVLVLPALDRGVLLLQAFDQVQVGVGDLGVVIPDLEEVLLVLRHDLLDLGILRLLDLRDLRLALLLHVLSDRLHAQLVLLLHVSSSSVELLPQVQDRLVTLHLQHPDEVVLGHLGLLHLNLQGALILLDLGLGDPMVVLLELQRELPIRLQFHDLVLLVVAQVLQSLLEHFQLDLLPLLEILVLAVFVPQIGLLLG